LKRLTFILLSILKVWSYFSFYFYAILGVFCITFGFRAYDPRVFLLQMSHLGIFTIIFFFGNVSDYEIFKILRRHREVLLVKIFKFWI
jgi:hypothetical protein